MNRDIASGNAKPFARGVNSIQLLKMVIDTGSRTYSGMQNGPLNLIPERYLPQHPLDAQLAKALKAVSLLELLSN
jgi:hypothetical protein